MGMKARLRGKEKRRADKRARKESMRLQFQAWAEGGAEQEVQAQPSARREVAVLRSPGGTVRQRRLLQVQTQHAGEQPVAGTRRIGDRGAAVHQPEVPAHGPARGLVSGVSADAVVALDFASNGGRTKGAR